jgi:hypothetical protein
MVGTARAFDLFSASSARSGVANSVSGYSLVTAASEIPSDDVLKAAKVLAVHSLITHYPMEFACRLDDAEFEEHPSHHRLREALQDIMAGYKWRRMVELPVLVVVFSFLPWIYGHFFMTFPCASQVYDVKVQGAKEWTAEDLRQPEDTCRIELFIRSAASVWLCPAILAVTLSVAYAFRRCSANSWRFRRLLYCYPFGPFRILQMLFHKFLRKRMYRVSYGQIFIQVPWWAPVLVYVLLLIEFLILALLSGELGAGLVTGYAVGEIYCRMTSNLLGAFDEVITVVQAEIRGHADTRGLALLRLLDTDTTSFGLSHAELDAIAEVYDTISRSPAMKAELLSRGFDDPDAAAIEMLHTREARLLHIYVHEENRLLHITDLSEAAHALAGTADVWAFPGLARLCPA